MEQVENPMVIGDYYQEPGFKGLGRCPHCNKRMYNDEDLYSYADFILCDEQCAKAFAGIKLIPAYTFGG